MPTISRRHILNTMSAIPAATLATMAPLPAFAEADPVVDLALIANARYDEYCRRGEYTAAAEDALRAGLGLDDAPAPEDRKAFKAYWGAYEKEGVLKIAREEDRASDRYGAALSQLIATRSTTLAGVIAKLELGVEWFEMHSEPMLIESAIDDLRRFQH